MDNKGLDEHPAFFWEGIFLHRYIVFTVSDPQFVQGNHLHTLVLERPIQELPLHRSSIEMASITTCDKQQSPSK